MESKLFLRKAQDSDRDMLFEWANDDVTRINSFTSDKIEYDVHCDWFYKMMMNPDRIQYILMLEDENNDVAVGQIRLDLYEDTAEISYSIDKRYRGRGFGNASLKLVKEEV